MTQEKKDTLLQSVLVLSQTQKEQRDVFYIFSRIQSDPYFPILEDLCIDGTISREEFLALEYAYERS